jgi:hypothetical protein
MNYKLELLLNKVLDRHEALSLDSAEDKQTLLKALAKELTPVEFSDVVKISEAIFPQGVEVDETFMDCEVVVYTGMYNVAAGGSEEAHLVTSEPIGN